GIARGRAGLIDRAEGRDSAHEVAAPPVRANGQAAADDLAETREIGTDAILHLSAAERKAEAGDDLVEDQHRAVARAEIAQGLQEAGRRRHDAHVPGHRLDDDGGDLAAARLADPPHA